MLEKLDPLRFCVVKIITYILMVPTYLILTIKHDYTRELIVPFKFHVLYSIIKSEKYYSG